MTYLPSHLSPSQLTTYSLCPALYRERYVLKIFPPAEPERLFGIAVHKGIEADFRGEDGEMTFLRTWREYLEEIDQAKYPGIGNLKSRGLELLADVRALGLAGEPEHHIVLTAAELHVPIFGYADLWGDGYVVDFKTCGYGWTQKKADMQAFQPAIYSQAYALEHDGQLPEFRFIALPRVPAKIQIFDGSRTYAQIFEMFEQARTILECIEAQQFECRCKGRYHEDEAA